MAHRVARRHPVAAPVALVVLAALCLPLVVMIGASFNPGTEQVFPPRGLSLRWYANILNRDGFLRAFQLSMVLGALSALVSVLAGTLAALAVVRYRFPGRDALVTLLLSPLIVPGVVIGMAFLVSFAALGVFRSFPSLFVLHVVLTLPFAVRVVVGSLTRFKVSLEEAARVLGAPPWRAFLTVTVPVIRTGMVAAAIFAFVTSFDNFTASQFLVWDRSTLPVEIYSYVRTENDPTVAAICTLLVVGVSAVVVVLDRYVGIEAFTGR